MEKDKELPLHAPIKIGISMGDSNGVSPEIIMKALQDQRILLDCTPVIYGSSKVFSSHKKELKDLEFNFNTCKTPQDIQAKKINFIHVNHDEYQVELGKPTSESGKLAFLSLEHATKDLAAGVVDVLVTAPISKDAMNKSGFQFPGHTEYLADMAGTEALMVLCSDALRVALATIHIPLKEVATALTKELIVEKIRVFENSLTKDFGLHKPKIAVLGLNPHAGENGKIGEEEKNIIEPAIQQVRNEGILAFGPYPADGLFGSKLRAEFDGILAMYHDQGLTGFKALAFEDGVNFTAGLPVIRTSPDHGTAYDIAGQDKASPNSFRESLYLAMDIHRNRKLHKEINANKLVIEKSAVKKTENKIQ